MLNPNHKIIANKITKAIRKSINFPVTAETGIKIRGIYICVTKVIFVIKLFAESDKAFEKKVQGTKAQ